MSQFSLLLQVLIRPRKAFSGVLDYGRLLFAVAAAAGALALLQIPRSADLERERMLQTRQATEKAVAKLRAKMEARTQELGGKAIPRAELKAMQREMRDDMDENEPGDTVAPPSIPDAIERFTARSPVQYLAPLLALAVCFVPIVILVLTIWDNLGGFSTILFRDYVSLLVCCLLAWAAPYLLLALVNLGLGIWWPAWHNHAALWWAAQGYFAVLAVLAARTVFGTGFWHSLVAAGAGWGASVGGALLFSVMGGAVAYLASPFALYMLYYLYSGMGPEIRSLAFGLRSRQRLKQGLENATLNPRDADAHYQLGLIYVQRRQYEPAIERFRKAIEIDPGDPDAHYQLGRVAREQGRYQDALDHCRTAARIDDKLSLSEVWREIGIASLLAGNREDARQALEKYLERRPYDPEGNCWYGRAMAQLGNPASARAAFEQAIEAVRTMPPARKRQVRSWESESRRELKKLPGAGSERQAPAAAR